MPSKADKRISFSPQGSIWKVSIESKCGFLKGRTLLDEKEHP
ncbi:MAG: hypothetical protein PHX86_02300 [Caldisericia bacterium]|nr:hypothetical protein [Caldisericia bacterium]